MGSLLGFWESLWSFSTWCGGDVPRRKERPLVNRCNHLLQATASARAQQHHRGSTVHHLLIRLIHPMLPSTIKPPAIRPTPCRPITRRCRRRNLPQSSSRVASCLSCVERSRHTQPDILVTPGIKKRKGQEKGKREKKKNWFLCYDYHRVSFVVFFNRFYALLVTWQDAVAARLRSICAQLRYIGLVSSGTCFYFGVRKGGSRTVPIAM